MHRTQIGSTLVVLTLAAAACAPVTPTAVPATTVTVASPPLTSGSTRAPTSAQPSGSPSPPAARPSASASAVAAPQVNIVEPAFRSPQEWNYAPADLTVKVGTAVVWTNTGAVAHTVTSDDGTGFDSGSIDPKATFTFAATSAGTFAYHCTFHPWMRGTLVATR